MSVVSLATERADSLDALRQRMPAYAKDTKLNLTRVLAADGSDGLTATQVWQVALSSAYATRHAQVIGAIEAEAAAVLEPAQIEAAKAATTIMAMNNVYYRFVHLVSDNEYSTMPAGLRMNVLANPGVDKVDFELTSLAVSSINGCGMCIDAHVDQLIKAGVSKQGVQTTIRIAAVLSASAQALEIENVQRNAA